VLVGVLAPIVILLSPWHALGLAATLLFVLAAVGSGVTCWIDAGDPIAQAVLTFMLGLAIFALAAVIMIWTHEWYPTVLLLLAVPTVLSCVTRLDTGRVGRPVYRSKK